MTVLTGPDFATGSEIRTAYVPETTYGIVPTTPAFKTLRITGGPGLRTSKVTATSDEIQPDRNVRDLIQLGQDVSGSFPAEFTYGSFDDWLEAVMMGTWTNNVLQNASARRSFTIEQAYQPNGVTISERRFSGCKLSTLALSIVARQKITATFGLMGQRELDDTADLSGATYAASATSPVLTASGSVAALALGTFPAAPVRRIDINIDNHLYARPEVGNLYTDELGEGRFDMKGTLELYFRDNTIAAAALAHQNAALSFTVGQAAGSRYTFAIPNLKLGDVDVSMPGNDQDVIATINYQALLDPASGASLIITRGV